jgi:hypothetical protein
LGPAAARGGDETATVLSQVQVPATGVAEGKDLVQAGAQDAYILLGSGAKSHLRLGAAAEGAVEDEMNIVGQDRRGEGRSNVTSLMHDNELHAIENVLLACSKPGGDS